MNEPSLTPEQQALFDSHLWMAAHAAKHRCVGISYDEAYAAACEGVFEAAKSFDPAKQILFRTYAKRRVHGAIVDYVRALQGRKGQKQFCRLMTEDENDSGNLRSRHDALAIDDTTGQDLENDEFWEVACVGLSATEKAIVTGYYRDGHTMKEVAEELGVCESRVSQINKHMLPRMRPRIERHMSL